MNWVIKYFFDGHITKVLKEIYILYFVFKGCFYQSSQGIAIIITEKDSESYESIELN